MRTDVDLSDITKRLSALPEPYVLAYFWLMVREDASRMPLLQQLAAVTIWRPKDWDRAAIRRDHESAVARCEVQHRRCFACDNTGRLFFHHVIEIQHGGSNHRQNKVPLCFPCHQILHPWLTEAPPPYRGNNFESLGQIIERRGPRLIEVILEEAS